MGFDDAFDSSLIDYSSDFEEQDNKWETKLKIEEWLKKYTTSSTILWAGRNNMVDSDKDSIRRINYTLNGDLSIDVLSECYIDRWLEEELPDYIQFNIATKDFGIANGKFKTLKGSPRIVYGTFSCHNNENLKTLIGGPKTVYEDYFCSNKHLKSLEGAPEVVGNTFNFCNCPKLKSLDYLPQARIYNWNNVYYYDIKSIIKDWNENNDNK